MLVRYSAGETHVYQTKLDTYALAWVTDERARRLDEDAPPGRVDRRDDGDGADGGREFDAGVEREAACLN
jgi:hypothetical protein